MNDLNATSRDTLANYINNARKLAIYGGESGWHADKWMTTTLRNPISMEFCELRKKWTRTAPTMQSPFLEFAKAYVRHRQTRKEIDSIKNELQALRFLYAALKEVHGTPDILQLDGAVQELIREKVTAWYASGKKPWRIGYALMSLYAELRQENILPALPHWKAPWERINTAYSMEPKVVEWRKKRAPDDQKLAAMLAAFQLSLSLIHI